MLSSQITDELKLVAHPLGFTASHDEEQVPGTVLVRYYDESCMDYVHQIIEHDVNYYIVFYK